MTREEMLQALQTDVNAWPGRVKAAGVVNAAGSSYGPLARNNEILRTPDDPDATYRYMLRVWEDPDADLGSDGWYRIIKQAGPELTWEWLMVDRDKPYAPLFDDALRERVKAALERDAGYPIWMEQVQAKEDRAQRVRTMVEEMRSGARKRPQF
jgi:hypothetical protein